MDFSIYYQNVRGLQTKDDCFYASLANSPVIAVTETSFCDYNLNEDYFPSNYTVFLSDRDLRQTRKTYGGGSCIGVHTNITCISRNDLELIEECVWLELRINLKIRILVGNHYFSPDFPPKRMSEYFNKLTDCIATWEHTVLILGDFNIPIFNWRKRILT